MRRLFTLAFVLAAIFSTARAADPDPLFVDSFDGKLGDGWSWLREDAGAWRIKDGALEIRVQPGVASNVKNALVRSAPDRSQGKLAFEITVTNLAPPTQQYEQAGITWYHNGQPLAKLVKEYIDGKTWIVLGGPTDPDGKRGLAGKTPVDAPTVRLRLTVTADRYQAEFQPGEGKFQPAGSGPLPPPRDDQVSVQCYNGPPDAEHWFRWDDFRIVKLPE
ncbi:MAG: hypothetical protein HUU20_06680 [Pirellulales bacterium]|nr:hypothetical protein [Pirellulales bacterium]